MPSLLAVLNIVDRDNSTLDLAWRGGGVMPHTRRQHGGLDWGSQRPHQEPGEDAGAVLGAWPLLAEFRKDLLVLDLEGGSDVHYCSHMGKWLCCYSKQGATARLKPSEYVVGNYKNHKNMMDCCKAQYFHSNYGK